ncbi:MAG: toll/interleukin-1 receptor domain-containing protein, partial [Desulfobacteraceae bacterium]|nr:toll/interleukin-1 receptor domain-containing protein [Desulfobacteraceae bacterium]
MADSITGELGKNEITCWIDRLNIGPAEKWHNALREGILDAGNFVVLLNKDWTESEICLQEYQFAVDFGKTLIPVVVEPVSPSEWKEMKLRVPDELSVGNYIWVHELEFSQVIMEIAAAVKTDYDWKSLLRRLEQRADRWQSNGEAFGLLRGQELLGVQETITKAHQKTPQITDIVSRFVHTSQQEEMKELEKQRKRARKAESRVLAAEAKDLCFEEPIQSLNTLN